MQHLFGLIVFLYILCFFRNFYSQFVLIHVGEQFTFILSNVFNGSSQGPQSDQNLAPIRNRTQCSLHKSALTHSYTGGTDYLASCYLLIKSGNHSHINTKDPTFFEASPPTTTCHQSQLSETVRGYLRPDYCNSLFS